MIQNNFFKNKIKNTLIVHKDNSPEIIKIMNLTNNWLKKNKVKTHIFSQSLLKKHSPITFNIDLVIVLGGDGTYLQVVQCITNHLIPFLGINMGSFGFLTVHKQESVIHCLESILKKNMLIEERSLINISCFKKNKLENKFIALNELVIERGSFSQLINISMSIQNQNLYSMKADGVIISSPTGSTAYNLAAGGPILHPQVNSFAITPICPHSLTNRPVIIPDTYTVDLKINNTNQTAFLTIDGNKMAQISNKHIVKIQKSIMKHRTLRNINHNDFLLLKNKLKFSQ